MRALKVKPDLRAAGLEFVDAIIGLIDRGLYYRRVGVAISWFGSGQDRGYLRTCVQQWTKLSFQWTRGVDIHQ